MKNVDHTVSQLNNNSRATKLNSMKHLLKSKSCYFIFLSWNDMDYLKAVMRLLFIFRMFSFFLGLFYNEVCSGPFYSLFCLRGLIPVSWFALSLWKCSARWGPVFLKTSFLIVTSHSKTEYIFLNIIAYFFHVFTWGHIKNVLDSFLIFSNTVNYVPYSIFIVFHPSLPSSMFNSAHVLAKF